MKIHIFQHAHFEDPGNIIEIANHKGWDVTYTHFYEDFTLPNLADFDLLIIMGAPMSVHDEDEFPWLKEEKIFILKAIKQGKKVLGICFGSQLIAEVLGVKVYPNKQKEIGWFNIKKNQNGKSDFLSLFENELMAFHWHGDTYDIPKKALPIFSSLATKNQGFTYGDKVIGLQFHWEVTKENVNTFIKNSDEVSNPKNFIQNADSMLSFTNGFETNPELMKKVLDYFTD